MKFQTSVLHGIDVYRNIKCPYDKDDASQNYEGDYVVEFKFMW